ncbi:hypothetical protein CLAFUW4_05703 [Fulvia fulva]|nr:hypothetical protein CLAFUR4_05697 [Fulvia fulva]WPV15006.1 hypothetical protein CLAFUW4_05703 [Fulvia fulva]WPV29431.1 hypothetical protein CLAFUW7_05701 [Fulvia fulva]
MTFQNEILGTTTDLKSTQPMDFLLNNIPEDFAIMTRSPETGLYSFRGGIIMGSLGWDLGSKIGLQLHEIHTPVPDYKEKMQFLMDRFFAKMPTDKPIQRGSWGLEVDKPMYLPLDECLPSHGEQDPDLTIDRVHLRVDWQTLRRLPLSGAIVFNFKCLLTPAMELRDEPYIPSLLLKLLKEGRENLMAYKGHQTDHVTIPALEVYEKEQLEKGLIEKDWDPHTLDESPSFPGWREKWRRQQGV